MKIEGQRNLDPIIDYDRLAVEKRQRVAALMAQLERRLTVPRDIRLRALAEGVGDPARSTSEQYESSPFPFLIECVAVGFCIGKLTMRK